MRIINKVLITGITGSGGSYLADYIVENFPNIEVHGISRWHSTSSELNLEISKNKVYLHECDLNDFSSILNVLTIVKPDAIFHLASHANVRVGFINPLAVLNNNIMSTANLLEAIRYSNIDPWIQLCSTSEVYGQVDPKNVPINESCPINPSSPYAVSKATQDFLGYTYFKSYNLKIIRTRMFTYLNPRREDLFATSFAKQVARIEVGLQDVLYHGNLDSVRTIIDVRDAMRAYWDSLLYCEPGEVYNIGGTNTITVGEFLILLKKLSKVEIISKQDPKLMRPSDVTLQIPDTTKFQNLTGWKPKYSFEESVNFLLDSLRNKINK